MLNIYNNVVRYMYTERKQMRNMVHQYERGLYHHTGKNGEAQLKFELNNYLFRGLIKLKKCRFMPLKKLYKYRFNFTNICTLVYHSTVKWFILLFTPVVASRLWKINKYTNCLEDCVKSVYIWKLLIIYLILCVNICEYSGLF